MNKKEVIDLINQSKFLSLSEAEWELENLNLEKVWSWLDRDEHRHYEMETSVYKCADWFVWIFGVSKIYSEMGSYNDIWEFTQAFEMQEITTTTYKTI